MDGTDDKKSALSKTAGFMHVGVSVGINGNGNGDIHLSVPGVQ